MKKKVNKFRSLDFKNNKFTTILYFLLRLLVLIILIYSIVIGKYENAFTCLLVLILLVMPFILEEKLKIFKADPFTSQYTEIEFVIFKCDDYSAHGKIAKYKYKQNRNHTQGIQLPITWCESDALFLFIYSRIFLYCAHYNSSVFLLPPDFQNGGGSKAAAAALRTFIFVSLKMRCTAFEFPSEPFRFRHP